MRNRGSPKSCWHAVRLKRFQIVVESSDNCVLEELMRNVWGYIKISYFWSQACMNEHCVRLFQNFREVWDCCFFFREKHLRICIKSQRCNGWPVSAVTVHRAGLINENAFGISSSLALSMATATTCSFLLFILLSLPFRFSQCKAPVRLHRPDLILMPLCLLCRRTASRNNRAFILPTAVAPRLKI